MKVSILFTSLFLNILISFSHCFDPLSPDCSFTLFYTPHFPRADNALDEPVRVYCHRVGVDNQTLDEILYRAPIPDRSGPRSFKFSRLTEWVREIRLNLTISGNITIRPGVLPFLPVLESLSFESRTPPSPNGDRYFLVIHEHLFEKMPRLRSLTIQSLSLAESTMQAFSSMKHRLNRLSLTWASPGRPLVQEISKFTNLTHLTMEDICENQSFPLSTFRQSAPKLKSLSIKLCSTPTLTRDLFRSMRNLQDLEWRYSSISSIGESAFDDLANLEELDLAYNKISTLPDGLFKRMKKLKNVDFVGNDGIENLSRANFSHVQGYDNFQLNLERSENGNGYKKRVTTEGPLGLEDGTRLNENDQETL